jgi:hypothetical protein
VKVGDLVRHKVTRADNTLGIVVSIDKTHPAALSDTAYVLKGEEVFMWSTQSLEVLSESR